ncbi:MAG TPA: hypothetical protein VEC16_00910 [Alphaproteobacteria bacterium]|nr:hypothetical protein [Alphaproteobacteria bacterium]
MSLKQNFFNIFKSLNPYNYIELSNNRITLVFRYFFFLVMLLVTTLFIVSVPYLYNADKYVSGGSSHFDALSFQANIQVKEPFNIMAEPLIRVDNSGTNASDVAVLITPEKVSYKKFFFFGAQKSVPLNRTIDVVNSKDAQDLVVKGMYFILPSIFFWSVVFWILYFLAIIIFTYILVMMASGSLRIDASAVHLFKMSVYTSTILIITQLALLIFYKNMIIPIAAYWIFIMFVIFLWYDNPPGRGGAVRSRSTNGGEDDSDSSGSKTDSIFGSKKKVSGFSYGTSSKSQKMDSYDVDERGNLKGQKRKKSFDEENDGYVEL